MKRISHLIVRYRVMILLLAFLLLIPSAVAFVRTETNYDLLTYLPDDIDTMQGQEILKEEFGTGAFSMFIAEGLEPKRVADLKKEILRVDHVKDVLWYDSAMDLSVPMEMLPREMYEAFNRGEDTLMIIVFDDTTSADSTTEAVRQIRKIADKNCFLGGMSAIMVDTEDLSNREAPIYVGIAVLLSVIVLSLTMDSYLVPFLFLTSIGMAILYNMGTNFFMGRISYITKALAAVLQMGATMDYSIFLWHSYEEEKGREKDKLKAMEKAVSLTISSLVGSSVTTIAGFAALCFMSFRLGMDMGFVMAKGVLLGVLSCITILPSMTLVLDKALEKTRHRPFLPEFKKIGNSVMKHYMVFIGLTVLLMVPAVYGYKNMQVYYNLDRSLPKKLASVQANDRLNDDFHMNATHVLMLHADVPARDVQALSREMKQTDGIRWVIGLNAMKGGVVPNEFIPDKLTSSLQNENWQLLMIGSEYATASPEVNQQIEDLTEIAKRYDSGSMLIGEAPCTRDLINISNHDFNLVNDVSIGIIFLILLLVFRSVSIPLILVGVIEAGIYMNMGINFYTGTTLPFIANIVIGTIQLGSTVDYAVLMTTRYRRERLEGVPAKEAVRQALQISSRSILVSAMSFFAVTCGVGLYSTIDAVGSLCMLMARGALISMMCVIFVLPGLLVIFDRVIAGTTLLSKAERETVLRNKRGAKI